ncbi:MAG: carbamoyltransferase HypF [Saprospiraceae bacterium]
MTWHIHIEGQVQGVGFRPFVYKLAKEYGLNGWVNNATDGVHIEINATENVAQEFYGDLIMKAPALAQITKHIISIIDKKFFDNFEIIHSQQSGKTNLLLTPDFAICEDCRQELNDHKNRRNKYPFITCTNCGPRYSIIHQLPYDRVNTKMDVFKMCNNCLEEYENPLDRRYYSQTNSCLNCSVELTLYNANKNKIAFNQNQIIEAVVQFWKEGKIVAIKGIGGYILTCDAENTTALLALRKRKHRPSKPFALMYPDLESLNDVHLEKEAEQELTNHVSPIVLLEWKGGENKLAFIAPNLNQVGVMLPYTPLYDLLLKKFGSPIVATSGNISHSPIVFKNKKALNELSEIADYILTNNREITVPQDDSVVKFSFFKNEKIIIRRSRGLAPTYINAELEWPDKSILATGAMLKSTFSFLHQRNVYISQYLGDLEHFDTQQNYTQTIEHFFKIFNAQPEFILCDKHPEYPSTIFGNNLSEKLNTSLKTIQHHIAHFGAVLGENNLLHTESPVLGVIWDGTGLGDDGQIWGGEFFKYNNYNFIRCNHFDYFDFILGDKMPREPRISALSACWGIMGAEDFLKEKFNKTEWQVYAKILAKNNPLQTSSVGRIFDAVASLLGILDKQTFEGEAAMQLEALASDYFKKHGLDFTESYFTENPHDFRIPTKALLTNLILDLKKEKPKDFIAAKFHFSLVQIIKTVAENSAIKKLAFSGGVFQNSLLVDLIIHHLKPDYELYFHQQLSANDENISFGQLVCHQIEQLNN